MLRQSLFVLPVLLRYEDTRQQLGGEPDSPHCHRAQQLVVRWQPTCRPTGRSDHEPDSIDQTQRARSACLPQGCDGTIAHATNQPDR